MMHSSLLSGHKRQFEESFYDCDDHLLSGNENGSSNFEEPVANVLAVMTTQLMTTLRMALMIRLCILLARILRLLILMMRMI